MCNFLTHHPHNFRKKRNTNLTTSGIHQFVYDNGPPHAKSLFLIQKKKNAEK